jgi:hypothetical protein
VVPFGERARERPGLRLGPADGGDELFRYDDAHPREI